MKILNYSYQDLSELCDNIWTAQMIGHPKILTYVGEGKHNRRASMKFETDDVRGRVPFIEPDRYDRDEYPFACTREGGKSSLIGHIDASQNRAGGSQLGHWIRSNDVKVGDTFAVRVLHHPGGPVTRSCQQKGVAFPCAPCLANAKCLIKLPW